MYSAQKLSPVMKTITSLVVCFALASTLTPSSQAQQNSRKTKIQKGKKPGPKEIKGGVDGVEWNGGFSYSRSSSPFLQNEIRILMKDLKDPTASVAFEQLKIQSTLKVPIRAVTLAGLANMVQPAYKVEDGSNNWFRVIKEPSVRTELSATNGRRVQAMKGFFEYFAVRAIDPTNEDRLDVRSALMAATLAAAGVEHRTAPSLARDLVHHLLPYNSYPSGVENCDSLKDCAEKNGLVAARATAMERASGHSVQVWELKHNTVQIMEWDSRGTGPSIAISKIPYATVEEADTFCSNAGMMLFSETGATRAFLKSFIQIAEVKSQLKLTNSGLWTKDASTQAVLNPNTMINQGTAGGAFALCN